MKLLYKFTLNKVQEVEKTEQQEDGSKIVKTVKEQSPVEFALKKPSRQDLDEGEFYYNLKYNEYIKGGILPEILLRKMYGNQNGIFTEKEKEDYIELYIELGAGLAKIRELEKKESPDEGDVEALEKLNARKREIQETISLYENAKQSIFDNSAETLTRNKAVFWWLLKLLYISDKGEFKPFFGADTHDERANIYDEIQEEIEEDTINGKFYSELIDRASFLTSLFYMNGNVKSEVFASLVGEYDAQIEGKDEPTEG